MAIVKHIKSRNANYSDALDYLIFQHDESTGKMILDEFNLPLRRDELYMDGLNCNPDTFDVECYECNEHFKKNRSKSEIKSHHYIISYDPADAIECDLTGEKAQTLSLELAIKAWRDCKNSLMLWTHDSGWICRLCLSKKQHGYKRTGLRTSAYRFRISWRDSCHHQQC